VSIDSGKKSALDIVKVLYEAGHRAYFAGGWVRDFIMGRSSDDIDIATDASPEEIVDLFPKTIAVGASFGVVVVVIDDEQFEVATFRNDGRYIDGRRPEGFTSASPEEDAWRRDFTINGMFYDPIVDEIYDFVGGREDLKRGIIRTIGDAGERFTEDRLRMLRAVRFACRWGFPIEENTRNAIKAIAVLLFPSVSMERVRQEFFKMIADGNFGDAVVMMGELGLLEVIFPEIRDVVDTAAAFNRFPEGVSPILYIAALVPRDPQQLCSYLRVSNRERKLMECLQLAQGLLVREGVELMEWAHFYAKPGAEMCLGVAAALIVKDLSEYEARRKTLIEAVERIKSKRPLVNATMLQRGGIEPGQHMGELLRKAERIAINRRLSDPQQVLSAMRDEGFMV